MAERKGEKPKAQEKKNKKKETRKKRARVSIDSGLAYDTPFGRQSAHLDPPPSASGRRVEPYVPEPDPEDDPGSNRR